MVEQQKGTLNAILAYAIWGVFPIYWKLLEEVNSLEILFGRIIWSFVFTFLLIVVIRQLPQLKVDLRGLWQNKKQFVTLFAASIFISLNWFIYIWAVNNGHLLQTSLGYYINPLISVLFGMIFFKERLSKYALIAVIIAAVGVISMTISAGVVPYVALILALSFGIYSVLKKKITLDATRGLAIETLFLLPITLVAYIIYANQQSISFLHSGWQTDILLMGSGLATAIPLILFAKATQRIPLILLSFVQYLSPTIVLLLGIFLYGEHFSSSEAIGFTFIWIAIIIFSVGNIYEHRKLKHK